MKQRRLLLLLNILLFTLIPVSFVSAFDESLFSENDIPPFVNNDAVTCTETSGGIVSKPGENLEKIYNFLISKGLTSIHAAAATGNIAVESAGAADPLIVERHPSADLPKSTNDPESLPIVSGWPGGQTRQPGWGLIQWTPASKFVTIAKNLNIEKPYELEAQLEVIWWHLTSVTPTGRLRYIEEFKQTETIDAATHSFMVKFLAPHASSQHYEERLAAANSILEEYGDNVPETMLDSTGCYTPGTGPGAGVIGDATGIVKTALNYAWPEAKMRMDLKPEYKAAIQAAKAKGENVIGAPGYPDGVDCHIFVKRVIRDSGADTGYSSSMSIVQALDYMRASPKYEEYSPKSESDLTPGTIIIYYIPGTQPGANGRHIFIYVGDNTYLQGSRNTVAEASIGLTAPRAGYSDPMGGVDRRYHYYFRLVK